MKRKTLVIGAVAALALGVASFAAAPTFAHGNGGYGGQMGQGYGHGMMSQGGQGMMGHGYGHGMMRHGGHGMMGQRYGHGMMGQDGQGMMGNGNAPCGQSQQSNVDRNLGVDDVKGIVEKHLEMRGNDRLKVGKVEASGDNTIVAEVVTVDDSLVHKIEFNTKTGAHRPIK
jgi:hypothetical protein